MLRMICITTFLVFAVLPLFSLADWKVERHKDEMTDKVTLFATVTNENAELYLYEDQSDYVGTFRLNSGNFKQIHYTPKVIMIRVDKNQARTVEFRGWEPKFVSFSLDKTLVKEMATGTVVKIQFNKSEYAHEVETFMLKGADHAFRTTLPSYTKKLQRKDPAAQKLTEQSLQEQLAAEMKELSTVSGVDKYKVLIRQRVNRSWNRPVGVAKGLKCVVHVRLTPGGEVLSAAVVRSSGNGIFDRSVENAVYKVAPLPLPEDPSLFDNFREIEFLFSPEE